MAKISKVYLLKNNKARKSKLELLNYLVLIFVLLVSVGTIYSLSQLKTYAEEIPTEDSIKATLEDKGENSKIYDRNGVLLYTFKDPGRDREYATFEEIPPVVVAAALAAEDKDFFVHEGIDYLGAIKGLATTVGSNGDTTVGGSTITQQLIKQTLLTNEQTFDRKMKEAMIALYVERDYSKEEILEYYLNVSNYGGRVQGIKTASHTYFDKPVEDLTLNEAVFLMSLVQSPGEYSPLFANDKQNAMELSDARRLFVLEQMQKNSHLINYLNTEDLDVLKYPNDEEVQNQVLEIPEENRKYNIDAIEDTKKESFTFKQPKEDLKAPHWVFYVRDLLQEEPYHLSIEDLYSGGYKIYTSLDLNIQKVAEQKLKEGVDKYGPRYGFQNGALVTIDPRNGEILAMVGSKGYYLENDPNNKKFDPEVNVTTARQSLGSSLKPWVAYLGIASGKYSANTIVDDSPQTFYGYYKPKNSDGKFAGKMTLSKALLDSRNLPFLKMSYQMGDWVLPDLMKEIGYRTDAKYGLAATVGGVDETLLDHTGAYTGLANGGQVMNKKPILKILNPNDSVKYQSETKVKKQLDANAVRQVNAILGNKNYTPGTYGYKFIGVQKLAGKTGTSDANKDTYYMGYGPNLVVGVWCGNNDNTRMTSNAFGSYTALPIWNHVMGGILSEHPEYGEYGRY